MTRDEKILRLNNLRYKLQKYQELEPEIRYRLKIIYGEVNKPTIRESIMHHIYEVLRKEKKYRFSQDEYFSCKVLDDDAEFLKLIKTHIELKIQEIIKEIDSILSGSTKIE